MKTKYIDLVHSFSKSSLSEAAEMIRRGGLVAFPTETVYGLGADATNPEAARKIYAAKGRPSDNPLIIHIASPADAEKYTYTCEMYYRLAERFMPGPLTVVLKSRETVPAATRGGLDTVAVRCPANPIAARLIELSGVPIAAPSANLSGSPSPTNAKHVLDDMDGRIDAVIDGGDCEIGVESTIVSCTEDGRLTLLRPGRITLEQLRAVADDITVADAVTGVLKEGERVLSPGMKYRHYAPSSPMVLIDGTAEQVISYLSEQGSNRIAIICYDEDEEAFSSIHGVDVYKFGCRDNEEEQAHRLFTLLRDVDSVGYGMIYAPLPRKSGMGLALYNRMIRASAHKIIKL